ncbi:MAG: hypothetical protein K6F76_03530 [Clostridiales bacterium]|nr:hypothetical protein [Clostridiales bacterium]
MTKRYFIWKDKNCKGVNPEWIELSAEEFVQFCKKNRAAAPEDKRYFYRVPNLDNDDCFYLLECTFENFRQMRIDAKRQKRKIDRQKDYLPTEIISLDCPMQDSNGEKITLYDLLPDESVCVEDDAIRSMEIHRVREIVDDLPKSEKDLIYSLFFNNHDCLSDRKIAEKLGMPQTTLRNNKKKIFVKIKKSLAQN